MGLNPSIASLNLLLREIYRVARLLQFAIEAFTSIYTMPEAELEYRSKRKLQEVMKLSPKRTVVNFRSNAVRKNQSAKLISRLQTENWDASF